MVDNNPETASKLMLEAKSEMTEDPDTIDTLPAGGIKTSDESGSVLGD